MGCGGSTPETTIEPVEPEPTDDPELPAYMKEIKALEARLQKRATNSARAPSQHDYRLTT